VYEDRTQNYDKKFTMNIPYGVKTLRTLDTSESRHFGNGAEAEVS